MNQAWKMRRLAAVIVLLLAAAALAACSDNRGTEPSGHRYPPATITMVMPGDQSARMKQYLDNEFAQRMKEELNLSFDITYIPWAQYYDKLNLMFAAEEDLDLFWSTPVYLAQYVNKKSVMPVDQLLKDNGPDIIANLPKQSFDAVTLKGEMYALPVANAPSAEKFHSLLVRDDLLKDAGMGGLESVQDISDFAAKVKEKHPEITPIFEVEPIGPYYRAFAPDHSTLTPLGNTGYYYVIEEERDEKVYSVFDNEDIIQGISGMRADWRQKGYIKDNQLTNFGNAHSEFNSGHYAMTSGAAGDRAINFIGTLTKNAPAAQLNEYLLHPQKDKYIQMLVTDMFYIASQAKHPERAVQFLNWVFQNQDNYDFIIHGVKGKDYEIVGDKIQKLSTDELWPEWMFYNADYARFSTITPEETAERYRNWDEGAKLSKSAGFVFDNANVKMEETRVNQIIVDKIIPILWGFLDYETHYPEAKQALKDAGIEKIRLEYEAQLRTFLSE